MNYPFQFLEAMFSSRLVRTEFLKFSSEYYDSVLILLDSALFPVLQYIHRPHCWIFSLYLFINKMKDK